MTTHRSPGPWVVFVALIVCAAIAGPVYASVEPMEVVYTQNFENGHSGWVLDEFTRNDELEIVEDPFPTMTRDADPNHLLHGASMEARGGRGYCADSPTFSSLGVDTSKPYAINFRYGLSETPACWTYTLASKHVSIVVTACDPQFVYLAFVDELGGKVEDLGRIALGQLHDFEVLIVPHPHGNATVRIRIDGVVRGFFERDNPSGIDRVSFMDLPYRYIDATDEPNIPANTAFGSGYWDDVSIWRDIDDGGGPPPRNVKPRVEPNPFNPRTVISFNLDREASVRIDLFDVSGRKVRSLFDGRLMAGPQALPWDGRDDARADVASGVYLVRSVVDGVATVTRATVVR